MPLLGNKVGKAARDFSNEIELNDIYLFECFGIDRNK